MTRKTEKMSDNAFKFMNFTFKLFDFIYPHVKSRSKTFGISEGMKVIDYGCGPGRYTTEFAKIVGENGKVYAVDIHELAIEEVKKKTEKMRLKNVETILAEGYNCPLPDKTADMICALDIFFNIKKPTEFLRELRRLIKDDGILIIDEGHEKRSKTKIKIEKSGYWTISNEKTDHMRYKPIKN
jgi:ubiquinone/menaquinone biosynthesis C-methylase UbiE